MLKYTVCNLGDLYNDHTRLQYLQRQKYPGKSCDHHHAQMLLKNGKVKILRLLYYIHKISIIHSFSHNLPEQFTS